MAESKPSLSEVSENTTQLLQEATEKTTQTVINHTAKYNDAYSTIDKIMEGFWERVPYLIIAAVVLIVFWLGNSIWLMQRYLLASILDNLDRCDEHTIF